MDDLNRQWDALCNADQRQWEQQQLELLERRYQASMAQLSAPEKKKEHSLVKGAVVGGIVAGPAGAIVGALVQKDKNERGK